MSSEPWTRCPKSLNSCCRSLPLKGAHQLGLWTCFISYLNLILHALHKDGLWQTLALFWPGPQSLSTGSGYITYHLSNTHTSLCWRTSSETRDLTILNGETWDLQRKCSYLSRPERYINGLISWQWLEWFWVTEYSSGLCWSTSPRASESRK